MNRRKLLKTALIAAAGGSLLASKAVGGVLSPPDEHNISKAAPGYRKLGGKLEVSCIGLGVQNMPSSRK